MEFFSAAVIPSQWGGKGKLRPYIDNGQIKGVVGYEGWGSNIYVFENVLDVVGSKVVPNVRTMLQAKNPGLLILELPQLTKDLGIVPVTLEVPKDLGCPTGTFEVN